MSSAPRNDTAINMNMYFESLYIYIYINVCTNKSINIYKIYIYLHYTHYILNMYTFARHVCKKKNIHLLDMYAYNMIPVPGSLPPQPPPPWYGRKICGLQHSGTKTWYVQCFLHGGWHVCRQQTCKFVRFLQPTFPNRVICRIYATLLLKPKHLQCCGFDIVDASMSSYDIIYFQIFYNVGFR